jgi:hypothetical protein
MPDNQNLQNYCGELDRVSYLAAAREEEGTL